MNHDDIVRMAREAGFDVEVEDIFNYKPQHSFIGNDDDMERFKAIVYEQVFRDANYAATRTVTDAAIALEREACAKICDELRQFGAEAMFGLYWERACIDCAKAIRARGWK